MALQWKGLIAASTCLDRPGLSRNSRILTRAESHGIAGAYALLQELGSRGDGINDGDIDAYPAARQPHSAHPRLWRLASSVATTLALLLLDEANRNWRILLETPKQDKPQRRGHATFEGEPARSHPLRLQFRHLQ